MRSRRRAVNIVELPTGRAAISSSSVCMDLSRWLASAVRSTPLAGASPQPAELPSPTSPPVKPAPDIMERASHAEREAIECGVRMILSIEVMIEDYYRYVRTMLAWLWEGWSILAEAIWPVIWPTVVCLTWLYVIVACAK